MPAPLAELLAAVPALNDPEEPFTYEVHDGSIVGDGVSFSRDYFSGTSTSKEFSFLTKNGWQRKKGLLGGLFSR